MILGESDASISENHGRNNNYKEDMIVVHQVWISVLNRSLFPFTLDFLWLSTIAILIVGESRLYCCIWVYGRYFAGTSFRSWPRTGRSITGARKDKTNKTSNSVAQHQPCASNTFYLCKMMKWNKIVSLC